MQLLTTTISYISSHIWPTTVQQYDQNNYDFISLIPIDIRRNIFSIARVNLQEIAQVSSKWKEMAYDPELYKMIVPRERFGSEDWKEYIGTVENETLLPLCVFKDIARARYGWYLTWVPKTVKLTKDNGMLEKVILDSGLKLESIIGNCKEGHKPGYYRTIYNTAYDIIIEETRKTEKEHWVFINKQAFARQCSYGFQQRQVKDLSEYRNQTKGAHVSTLIDTLVTVFMEKIRSGKNCFAEYQFSNPSVITPTLVRVQEKLHGLQIIISVNDSSNLDIFRENDETAPNVAVLVERKSYGRGVDCEKESNCNLF